MLSPIILKYVKLIGLHKTASFVFSFLFLSSLFIALFSLYPMAFDEDFHLGLIRIYATSWIPYGIEHTKDMATYGLATADPSYLWHYIQSFPYRLLDWIGLSEQAIVILLRMLNIAVFMAGIWIYYITLRFAGFGNKFSSVVLAFFALIPIVPMLAGQINYDNPLFVIVGLSMLLALRIHRSFTHKYRLPVRDTWALIIVLTIGIAIKYAFLPIAGGIVVWLLFVVWQQRAHFTLNGLLTKFYEQTTRLRTVTKLLIASGLVISGFFATKYIVNYVEYGSPIPDCAEVFDTESCKSYGPWGRNYMLKQDLSPTFEPISFPQYIIDDWLPDMATRLTFAVAGPTNDYQTKEPIPLVEDTFIWLTTIGCLLALYFWRPIFRRPLMSLTFVVGVIYIGSLMVRLYSAYVKTGQPVAINGRYLLPLLPFIGAGLILGYALLLQKIHRQKWACWIAAIFIGFLVLSGAGIATYVLLAEPSWYW